MAGYEEVKAAFLSKMLDDDFAPWEQDGETNPIDEDILEIMKAAIPNFKFPRVSLEINEAGTDFKNPLQNEEVQIIATYMKCEWLNREILTWERIKPLYEERDFSEANMLSKLYDALEAERKRALRLESIYYRSITYSPWDYTRLAGDQ